MNPVLLFAITTFNKKYVALIAATMLVIISLPMVAVFSLGQSTLLFLEQALVGSDGSIGSTTEGLYQGPLVAGDTYDWGNCTYWVYYLRQQAGHPIPTTWGNASTWAIRARLGGYAVDQIPSVGAIMQISTVDDGFGHVAYVTKVDPNTGAWTISEMNVKGLDIVDTQTYPAGAALGFSFIHDKEMSL